MAQAEERGGLTFLGLQYRGPRHMTANKEIHSYGQVVKAVLPFLIPVMMAVLLLIAISGLATWLSWMTGY